MVFGVGAVYFVGPIPYTIQMGDRKWTIFRFNTDLMCKCGIPGKPYQNYGDLGL